MTPSETSGRASALLMEPVGLIDVVDRLLDRGVVLLGQSNISLAGVDLVHLRLNVLLSSVETLRQRYGGQEPGGARQVEHEPGSVILSPSAEFTLSGVEGLRVNSTKDPGSSSAESARGSFIALGRAPQDDIQRLPPHEATAPIAGETAQQLALPLERVAEQPQQTPDERVGNGLARLVLTLVELLRQILERQAVRRMAGGALSEADVERMGLALQELESKMDELRAIFGLTKEDLNLNLGFLES